MLRRYVLRSEGFLRDLRALSTEQVYNKYLVGGDIWYFKNQYGKGWYDVYDKFRLFISAKLGVHYNDVALAGSAKLGFSISPKKNFKDFDENSDIDIIIISQKIFYLFWEAYIKDSYAEIKMPNFQAVYFSIFRRYIIFDGFTLSNKIYADWVKKTQGFEKDIQLKFGIENEVHYRIFESWDSAKDYYMSSIDRSKCEMEE